MADPKYRPGISCDSIVTDGDPSYPEEHKDYGGKCVAESMDGPTRRRILALLNAFDRIPTEQIEALLEKHGDVSRRLAACVNACSAWGISTESLEDSVARKKWLLCIVPQPDARPEDLVPGYGRLVQRQRGEG